MPFVLAKWLTQIFVDCNRFNKGELYEVRIEWTLNKNTGIKGVWIKRKIE